MHPTDLARQMNVNVADVLRASTSLGLDLTEASQLSAEQDWALRTHLTAVAAVRTVPFADGGGLPTGRPAASRTRRDLPDMAKAILAAIASSSPTRHDREVAQALAEDWAHHWFTPAEASAWLRVHGSIAALTAAALRDAGVSAAAAATRLWYGQVHPQRRTIAQRVSTGDITAAEAAAQLHAAGRADG